MDHGADRDCGRVLFSGHAVRRMFERGLSKDHVLGIIRDGEVIAEYPNDSPYPSRLLLGIVHGKPVHVVLAHDDETDTAVVVTAYEPDPRLWDKGFRTRRHS